MKIPKSKKNDRLAFFTWAPERYHFWRRTRHHEQHHHFDQRPMTWHPIRELAPMLAAMQRLNP